MIWLLPSPDNEWDKTTYSQFLNPVGHDHDVTMITSCHHPVATATAIVLPKQLSRPLVLHSCCRSCCCCAAAAVVHVPQPQLLCSCCHCCCCRNTTATQAPLLQLLWRCRSSCCCQPLLPLCCLCNYHCCCYCAVAAITPLTPTPTHKLFKM